MPPACWGFLVVCVVLALSWSALRGIRIHEVRATLAHARLARWLLAAAAVTIANIAIMGLYDVLAFRHTRTRADRALALRRGGLLLEQFPDARVRSPAPRSASGCIAGR